MADNTNNGPNIYTVLVIIALLALWLGIGFAAHRLMSSAPVGYGVSFKMLFQPVEEQKKIVDKKWPNPPATLVPEE